MGCIAEVTALQPGGNGMAASSLEASVSTNQRSRRTGLMAWLVMSQLVTLVALVPWLGAALMSFMAFDAGVQPGAVAFVLGMWIYPLLALLCIILAWKFYRAQKDKLAAILSGLPVLPPMLLGILLYVL
jgi:uncharacterized membrane protein YdbT with pleckstrin-like domain